MFNLPWQSPDYSVPDIVVTSGAEFEAVQESL